MKYRTDRTHITDEAEERLAAEIRSLAGEPAGRGGPPDAYWQNLVVRVNEKIDRATSGKALSIAWAARVAIPGVVAIVSFLVGLHYYAPEAVHHEQTVADVLLSLPPSSIDSLLVDPSRVDPALTVEDVGPDVFVFSRDQIAEYFLDNGNPADAVDGISDREANTVFAVLASGSK